MVLFMEKPKEYHLKDYYKANDIPCDEHGQPLKVFNAKYRTTRAVNEMLGLCRGLIADGVLTEGEVACLNNWVRANSEVATLFPIRAITERLQRIFADRVVTDEERSDLLELLQKTTGQEGVFSEAKTTTAVFDDPLPEIVIPGKAFCFTGKFAAGTRTWCVQRIIDRGGVFHDLPKHETNYLVIGVLASRDWAFSSFGRKIERALELKRTSQLRIVPEEHWLAFVR